MVLAESQLAWEQEWLQRFREALLSKDEKRLSPFLGSNVKMFHITQKDAMTAEFYGKGNVVKLLTLKTGLIRDYHRVTANLNFRDEVQQIVYSYDATCMAIKVLGHLDFRPYRSRGTIVLHKDLGCRQEEVSRIDMYMHSLMPAEGRQVAEQKTSIYRKATNLFRAMQASVAILKLSSSVRKASSAEMMFR